MDLVACKGHGQVACMGRGVADKIHQQACAAPCLFAVTKRHLWIVTKRPPLQGRQFQSSSYTLQKHNQRWISVDKTPVFALVSLWYVSDKVSKQTQVMVVSLCVHSDGVEASTGSSHSVGTAAAEEEVTEMLDVVVHTSKCERVTDAR